jgi:thiosulfate reductase cytochrome b subunit
LARRRRVGNVRIEERLGPEVLKDSEVQHAAAMFNLAVNDISWFAVGSVGAIEHLANRVQAAAIRLNTAVQRRRKEILDGAGTRELRG